MKKETKVTLIKFTAQDIKERDITRFKNLFIKLGAKIEQIETGKQKLKLKGRQVRLVICDEFNYGMKELK